MLVYKQRSDMQLLSVVRGHLVSSGSVFTHVRQDSSDAIDLSSNPITSLRAKPEDKLDLSYFLCNRSCRDQNSQFNGPIGRSYQLANQES